MAKASTVAKANSGGFVTIASKLPMSLVLRVDHLVPGVEPTMNGMRDIKEAEKVGEIRLNGCGAPQGERPRGDVIAGFALTKNVPADLWEQWVKMNPQSPMLLNGILHAYESRDDLVDAVKEHKGVTSGLERLDMSNPNKLDTRVPKGIQKAARNDDEEDEGADISA